MAKDNLDTVLPEPARRLPLQRCVRALPSALRSESAAPLQLRYPSSQALSTYRASGGAAEVVINWKPFFIDPSTAPNGEDYKAYCRRRWGGDGWTMSLPGKREGTKFKNQTIWPNTRTPHRRVASCAPTSATAGARHASAKRIDTVRERWAVHATRLIRRAARVGGAELQNKASALIFHKARPHGAAPAPCRSRTHPRAAEPRLRPRACRGCAGGDAPCPSSDRFGNPWGDAGSAPLALTECFSRVVSPHQIYEEGANVSDRAVLADVGRTLGIDGVEEYLESNKVSSSSSLLLSSCAAPDCARAPRSPAL